MNINEDSFPFQSIAGDRKYKAAAWRKITRAMFSNGVFPVLSELQVTPGTGMSVVISAGQANIDGVIYTLSAPMTVNLTAADGVLIRKDKIIITVDESAREAIGTKLDGTPSALPSAPDNRWTSSYKDICLAIVTVSAGLTSVGVGNIDDKRSEPSLCGIAAPYQAPDTSGWYAAFQASFNAWMSTQQADFDEWFSTMVATLDENAAANLLNLINANKMETDAAIEAITPESIGAEPSRLQFISTAVAKTAFVADATYADYPYRASVALSGVLSTMVPHVVFGAVEAKSGKYAPVAACYNGGVYLYASAVPAANITVPTIICWR